MADTQHDEMTSATQEKMPYEPPVLKSSDGFNRVVLSSHCVGACTDQLAALSD